MNPLKALRDMRTIGALLGDAERIARRMGDEEPSAEHLLIAAVGLPDGGAARAFGAIGVDPEELERGIRQEQEASLVAAGIDPRSAAELAKPSAVQPPTGAGIYRSSASARELFTSAGTLARAARQRLSSAHVVLAASELEHGTVPRIFDRLGIDRAVLRDAARAELA